MATPLVSWLSLQQRLDKIVDGRWDEPVELHPWAGGAYSSDGAADPTRKVLVTRAVFMVPGAAITGEAGSGHGSGDAQQLENECWLDIQDDRLGDPTRWRAYDRVNLVFRVEWFSIAWIGPGATRRSKIHLVRLQKGPAGLTMPLLGHQRVRAIQARRSPSGRA